MPRRIVPWSLFLAAGLVASCGGAKDAPRAALEPIPFPAAPGSGEPNVAVGDDGAIHVSWVEPAADSGSALRFATWTGGRWSEPRTVAHGTDWFVNWADVPSIAVGSGAVMAAHWLRREGKGTYAYGVRVALSADGGATWSDPVRPHGDATESEHGFASMTPRPDGGFDLVWLDGRETAMAAGEDEHGGAGAMTLRHAILAPDGTIRDEGLLDDRVCDCCPTDAIRLADGRLLVAYRDRSEVEVRDIGVIRGSGTEWESLGRVHDDAWTIPGCPVNGPAVDADGDRVVCAWFTMGRSEEPAVNVAFSADGGATFSPPRRIDEGKPIGRVDVAFLENGDAAVSWIEAEGDSATIRLSRVPVSGSPAPSLALATVDAGRSSGCPRLARGGDDLILAWTDVSVEPSRVRTGRVRW